MRRARITPAGLGIDEIHLGGGHGACSPTSSSGTILDLLRLANAADQLDGRGYSFNAIRAKLLYAETTRKHPKARPL
jgi:hypothetical protein